jgi:hypothetical protein
MPAMPSKFPISSLQGPYGQFCRQDIKNRVKAGLPSRKPNEGAFPLNVEDEYRKVTTTQVKYAMTDERWFLLEEFDVAVNYLRQSELFSHPFLDPTTTITIIPVFASTSQFETPEDQLLNDFLMRLRPFLFDQDMFYWQDMLFRLHQDVEVDTDYLSKLFEVVTSCCNGDNFGQQMIYSKEGKRFFDTASADRLPKRIGIGSDQHQAYALSGGNCNLTFYDVKSWLFGKKYHHNHGMFMHYRSLLETMTERDFLHAARLHFFDLLRAIFGLQETVRIILLHDRKRRALTGIVAAIRSRAV